jgi:hypothetical protein
MVKTLYIQLCLAITIDDDFTLLHKPNGGNLMAFNPLKLTKAKYDEFYNQMIEEYGQVWSMPKIIRDRIRSIEIIADEPEDHKASKFGLFKENQR